MLLLWRGEKIFEHAKSVLERFIVIIKRIIKLNNIQFFEVVTILQRSS